MPKPSERTRSRKRVNSCLPGGNRRTRYKQEIGAPRRCSICNRPLAGFKHTSAILASKLNRSEKRIWRPHGGQVCHICLKSNLKQVARNL